MKTMNNETWRMQVKKFVRWAESEFKDKSGAEKRAVVINAVADNVRIPFVPAWLVRIILGVIVDSVVREFNEHFGHNWGEEQ